MFFDYWILHQEKKEKKRAILHSADTLSHLRKK